MRLRSPHTRRHIYIIMIFVLLFLAGAAGGLLGGMGMGGGTVLIPALTLFFKIAQTEAQGINLLSFVPMAIVAVILHAKNGLINVKSVLPVALPAVVFSVAGSFLVRLISGNVQTKIFGGFLLALSVLQFILSRKKA